jgi:translation initiation factor IF-2
VAADDGVMPQTIEAVNHAKAAGVPILVAINKIDKPGADPERIKYRLMEYGLVPEASGGDTIYALVSAKQKTGIDELLESILLQAEVMELKANPDKLAAGVVVEGRLDKGRGPVATVLVREGTLRRGDAIVAGTHEGRVRALQDHRGRSLDAVTPGLPAEVLGLAGVPMAGEAFNAARDEHSAREVAEFRAQREREGHLAASARVSLEDLFKKISEGEAKELRLVIKGDTQGTVEAVGDAVRKLSGTDVQVNVIHGAVGGVTESDVMLASASDALVIGFNVRPDPKAQSLAEQEKIQVKLYTVIYDAVEDIRKAMEGLLAPTLREKTTGRAEVRNTFAVQRVGTIAGCMVTEGSVTRGGQVRVIRDSVVVYEGRIGSLRRFKEDVREVPSGTECGIKIENYNDVKVGDVIEAYSVEELAPRLQSSPAPSPSPSVSH